MKNEKIMEWKKKEALAAAKKAGKPSEKDDATAMARVSSHLRSS